MDLEQIMQMNTFAVVGDTLNPEKYAYTLNEIPGDLDIIDLCINPAKGIQLLRECRKPFRCIVIQPGAESPEILSYLQEQNLPYIEGCLLVGMRLYPRKKQ